MPDRTDPYDWTIGPDNRRNSSDQYQAIVEDVAAVIRQQARGLVTGQLDRVARLIVQRLMVRHGLSPHRVAVGPEIEELRRLYEFADWAARNKWPAQMTDGEIVDDIINRAQQALGRRTGRADT